MKRPIALVLDDGDEILINRNGCCLSYLTLEELLILKNKVNHSIEFAKKNDIKAINELEYQHVLAEMTKVKIKPKHKISKLGFVYVMLDESLGYVKIGFSQNPRHRELTLQAQKPTIKMMFKTKASLFFEQIIHKDFNQFRIRGEWFNVSPEAAIEQINSYQNKFV